VSTVASRTFRSSPYRDSAQTWIALVELLTNPVRRQELAENGLRTVEQYSWTKVARHILDYINEVRRRHLAGLGAGSWNLVPTLDPKPQTLDPGAERA